MSTATKMTAQMRASTETTVWMIIQTSTASELGDSPDQHRHRGVNSDQHSPSCTGELQPLDCYGLVNDVLKKELKQQFVTHYADQFAADPMEGRDKIDMSLFKLKTDNLNANWPLGAMDSIANNRAVITQNWEKTKIQEAVVDKARASDFFIFCKCSVNKDNHFGLPPQCFI
uniref:Uncharacterized protein n=1 Tax=Branchiostoma floridae TaxID=7739 RepID=C3YY44_BRAFL|eukprot:XP_002598991.1 hypothetical protein BRAFLDRAFT_79924 [Branchiostoma floridae]